MYEVIIHHTDSNPSLIETVESYSQAVSIMKSIAKQWEQYLYKTVIAKRNRIEYRADGYGMAVYIEKI